MAANIEFELKEEGKQVNLIEILIAAVAIENNAMLITRDGNYKHIKQLQVEL